VASCTGHWRRHARQPSHACCESQQTAQYAVRGSQQLPAAGPSCWI
jgi:hypothetical protein